MCCGYNTSKSQSCKAPRTEEASMNIPHRWRRVWVPVFLGLALTLGPGGLSLFDAPGLSAEQSTEAWPDIPPEERNLKRVEQDPDADAVVLLNERNGRILKPSDDIVNILDYHFRYKILTERGKRYGDVEIPAGKYSRVSNIRARTVKSDGTVVPVPPDQIFEKVTFQVGAYKETVWV